MKRVICECDNGTIVELSTSGWYGTGTATVLTPHNPPIVVPTQTLIDTLKKVSEERKAGLNAKEGTNG